MFPRIASALLAAFTLTSCGSTPETGALSTPERPTSAVAVAESLYASGAHDSARLFFRIALDSAVQRGDSTAVARMLTWLGLTAFRLGEYDDARRLGRQALDLKLRLGIEADLFQSYNALGLLAYEESRYIDAIRSQEHALRHAEQAADTANLTRAWNNLGLSLFEMGDFGRALELWANALDAARGAGNRFFEGRILINIGMARLRTGAPADAIVVLQEARGLTSATGDHLGELNALGQLAAAFTAVAEPTSALAALDTALQLSRAPGRESRLEEATALDQMADVFLSAGDPRRALSTLQQAISIYREQGLPHERAVSLRKVAAIQSGLGNARLADVAASEAVTIHRGLGSRLETILDLVTLAELRHRIGRREEAWAHLADARSIARSLNSASGVPLVALSEARLFDAEGRAADVLRVARAHAPAITDAGHDFEWELHAMVSRAHKSLGRPDSALVAAQRSVAAVERIRGQFGSSILRTSYLSERSAIYGELAGLLLDAGRVNEALAIADAARGRALLEHPPASLDSGEPSALLLAEQERHLLQQIDALAMMASESGNAADIADEARSTRERLELARAEYSDWFARTGRSVMGAATLVPDSVRRVLGADEALLEFLLTDAVSMVFVVTRDTIVATRLSSSGHELAARARLARELAGRPDAPGTTVRATFAALGSALLGAGPVPVALRGKQTLVVVPHRELVYVPFAALIHPATNRFLIEDVSIAYAPSVAALMALRTEAAAESPNSVAAFAPFTRALPHSRDEARSIRVEGAEHAVVAGRRATEMAVRRALSSSRVVHLATHGVLNRQNPLFSRIELARPRKVTPADDGRLAVHEVVNMKMQAALVFLSGCETGAGASASTRFDTGEDFATLAQAFLMAGAENVIATLWPVRDEGAAVFARRFYAALDTDSRRDRRGIAAALSQAQRATRADARFAAPYYWAGYALSGTGDFGHGTLHTR